MVNLDFDQLGFDHIVEFTKDSTLFAAARELDTGHLRLFLIYEHNGTVYTRNGRIDSWEEISGSPRYSIIARVTAARNSDVPFYKVIGTH